MTVSVTFFLQLADVIKKCVRDCVANKQMPLSRTVSLTHALSPFPLRNIETFTFNRNTLARPLLINLLTAIYWFPVI